VSILELSRISENGREELLKLLIPNGIFVRYNISKETLLNKEGERVVAFYYPESHYWVSIRVKRRLKDKDCILEVDLEHTPTHQLELSFIMINDLDGERFYLDVDEHGKKTIFGTVRRNIKEEIRAMEAGLAPFQIRKGLGLFRDFKLCLEDFAKNVDYQMIFTYPLGYHNAIHYERHGFGYVTKKAWMEEINGRFHEGGDLYEKLDGSSPFRRRGMEKTPIGRSWAIYDGILGEPFRDVKMVKIVGKDFHVSTFTP
jgi:hypothetical protein